MIKWSNLDINNQKRNLGETILLMKAVFSFCLALSMSLFSQYVFSATSDSVEDKSVIKYAQQDSNSATILTGKVTDTNGNPVIRAQIGAYNSTHSFYVYTTSIGTYTIYGIYPGTYTIRCYQPMGSDLFSKTTNNVIISSGQTTTVDFVLLKGGTIKGRVIDTNGNPVKNANISTSNSPTNTYSYSVITGTYALSGLADGVYILDCTPSSESNFVRTSSNNIVIINAGTQTVDFVLSPGGIITGKVTDTNGNPTIYQTTINVYGPMYKYAYTTVTGTYTIRGLSDGNYRIYCNPPSNLDFIGQNKSNIVVSSKQITTVDFVLSSGGSITGKVTDIYNKPVRNVYVYANSNSIGKSVYTDSAGNFVIHGLIEGIYTISCDPPVDSECIQQTQSNVSVSSGIITALNIKLPTGGTIMGKITDINGNPINNAYVSLGGGIYKSANVAADGIYKIQGIPEGIYQIYFNGSTAGFISQVKSNITVHVGQTTIIDCVLQVSGTISGKVTDINDNPVSGVSVYASGDSYGSGFTTITGTYTIQGLTEGSYNISYSPSTNSELISQTKSNIAVSFGRNVIIDCVLQTGGTITGKVMDVNDNSINNCYIYVNDVNGPTSKNIYTTTRTYTIGGLQDGNYTVSCRPSNYSEFTNQTKSNITVSKGQITTVDFVLQPGETISGKVTDISGNAISNVYIYLYKHISGPPNSIIESISKYAYTAVTGTYTICGLSEGKYSITYSPSSNSDFLGQTIDNVAVSSGQVTTLDIVLQSGGKIAGKVTDVAGNPVNNANIYLRNYSGKSVYTTATGTYTIHGLPEGNYDIYCIPGDNSVFIKQTKTNIAVSSGQVTTVNIVLQTGITISGKITDASGKQVISNVSISISNSLFNKNVNATSTGAYTITGVPEGSYNISCRPNSSLGFVSITKSNIQCVFGQETIVNFVLGDGAIISGKVTDIEGTPISNAYVYVSSASVWGSIYTKTDGTYKITGFSEGRYYVSANLNSDSPWDYSYKFVNIQNKVDLAIDLVLKPNQSMLRGMIYSPDGKTPYDKNVVLKVYPAETKFNSFDAINKPVVQRDSQYVLGISNKCEITRLPEGVYDIYAFYGSELLSTRIGVKTETGKISNLDFRVQPGTGKISGKVTLGSNQAVDGMVWAVSPATERLAGYCIPNIRSGSYTITGILGGYDYTVYGYINNIGLSRLHDIRVEKDGNTNSVDFNYFRETIPAGSSKTLTSASWQLDIPAGSYANDVVCTVIPNLYSPKVVTANEQVVRDLLPNELYNLVWNINLASTNGIDQQSQNNINLKLNYPAEFDNIAAERLRINYLKDNTWVVVDGNQEIDTINHTISVGINKFSVFRLALRSIARNNLDSMIVYPNPFKPVEHNKLVFSGLTKQTVIRIFNIAGELVRTLSKNDGADVAYWFGENDNNIDVASGIYIYVIKNDNKETRSGKIAVIR